ncbi:unnamed protein product [Ectocarpus fasciculatus]
MTGPAIAESAAVRYLPLLHTTHNHMVDSVLRYSTESEVTAVKAPTALHLGQDGYDASSFPGPNSKQQVCIHILAHASEKNARCGRRHLLVIPHEAIYGTCIAQGLLFAVRCTAVLGMAWMGTALVFGTEHPGITRRDYTTSPLLSSTDQTNRDVGSNGYLHLAEITK